MHADKTANVPARPGLAVATDDRRWVIRIPDRYELDSELLLLLLSITDANALVPVYIVRVRAGGGGRRSAARSAQRVHAYGADAACGRRTKVNDIERREC